MPLAGGFTVEYLEKCCGIQDKKMIFLSICNFCPAMENEEPDKNLSRSSGSPSQAVPFCEG